MTLPLKYQQNSPNPADGFLLLDAEEVMIGLIEIEQDAEAICKMANSFLIS